MIDLIHGANPLVGKEIITSSMPLSVQAFLNASPPGVSHCLPPGHRVGVLQ